MKREFVMAIVTEHWDGEKRLPRITLRASGATPYVVRSVAEAARAMDVAMWAVSAFGKWKGQPTTEE